MPRRRAALLALLASLASLPLGAAACGRETSGEERRNLLLPDPVPGVTPLRSDLLDWIRRDSELVLGANLVQLRTTPLWKQQLEPWLTAQLAATLPAMRTRCDLDLDLLASVEVVTVGLRGFLRTVEGSVALRGPQPKRLWDCLRSCREALRADGIDPMWDGDTLSLRTARGNGVVLVGEGDGAIRGVLGVEASSLDLKKTAKKLPMLNTSPGFGELYRWLDGNASGWFLLQGPLLQSAAEEHLALHAVFGSVVMAAGNGAGVTLDVRLRTSTPERAVRYADTANSRLGPAARAAFTHLAIISEGDDVHITASLTPMQLIALIGRGRSLAELLVPGPTIPAPGLEIAPPAWSPAP
jgi:hypothetical protein